MKKIKKNKKTLPEFRQHYTKENLAETSLLFPQVTEQPNCSGLTLPPRGDLGNCDLPYTRPLPLRDIMRLKNFFFTLQNSVHSTSGTPLSMSVHISLWIL